MFDIGKPKSSKKRTTVTKGVSNQITANEVFKVMAKWENFTDYDPEQLQIGIEVEMEHIDKSQLKTKKDWDTAYKIAEWITKAHIAEDYWYYVRLDRMEKEGEKAKEKYKKKGWDYRLYPPFINKKNNSVGQFEMGRPGDFTTEVEYERVVFLEGSEANEALEILERDGEESALEYLKQWHYPGEHETFDKPSYGKSDSLYRQGDYTMIYNLDYGYIGLEFTIRIPI